MPSTARGRRAKQRLAELPEVQDTSPRFEVVRDDHSIFMRPLDPDPSTWFLPPQRSLFRRVLDRLRLGWRGPYHTRPLP